MVISGKRREVSLDVPLPFAAFILVGNVTVSVRCRIRVRHAAVTMTIGASRRRPTMVATRGMDGLLIFYHSVRQVSGRWLLIILSLDVCNVQLAANSISAKTGTDRDDIRIDHVERRTFLERWSHVWDNIFTWT